MTTRKRKKLHSGSGELSALHFQLDAELHRRLNVAVAKSGWGKGAFLEAMVKAYLDNLDAKEARAARTDGVTPGHVALHATKQQIAIKQMKGEPLTDSELAILQA